MPPARGRVPPATIPPAPWTPWRRPANWSANAARAQDLGQALDRLDVEVAIAGGDRRGASRRLAALGPPGSQPTLAIRVASMGTQ